MESVNVIFDIVLIVFSLWMAYIAKKSIGGLIGGAIFIMNFGIVILGLAPFAETMFREFSVFLPTTQAFIMRTVILIGFFFLLAGFQQIRRVSAMAVK